MIGRSSTNDSSKSASVHSTDRTSFSRQQCEQADKYYWYYINNTCLQCSTICGPSADYKFCQNNCPRYCHGDAFYYPLNKTCMDCGTLCKYQTLTDEDREFCLLNCPARLTCGPGEYYSPDYGKCLNCSGICGPLDDPVICRNLCESMRFEDAWKNLSIVPEDGNNKGHEVTREHKNTVNQKVAENSTSLLRETGSEKTLGWYMAQPAAIIIFGTVSLIVILGVAIILFGGCCCQNRPGRGISSSGQPVSQETQGPGNSNQTLLKQSA